MGGSSDRAERAAGFASPSLAPYRVHIVRPDAVVHDPYVLASIRFGPVPEETADPRIVPVPLPALDGQEHVEVWRSTVPVRSGWADGVGWGENGSVLVAHWWADGVEREALADLTYDIYRRAMQLSVAHGYPYVLRMWNVVPGLNQGMGDAEGYKQFCLGRGRAFAETLPPGMVLPAASCVGTSGSRLFVQWLASATPGVAIENSRQVSAFDYPRCYGPRSPSFSRAILHRWDDATYLLASGTASIVGHETRHPGDAGRQLDETLENLQHLRTGAGIGEQKGGELSLVRVYLRHAGDLAMIRRRLAHQVDRSVPAIFLRADICRRPLVLEIEAVWRVVHSID